MPGGVICAIAEQRLRPEAAVAAGRRHGVRELGQLGYVVAVGSGCPGGERDAVARTDQVVL